MTITSSEDAEPPFIVVEDNKLPIDEEKRKLMDDDATLKEEQNGHLIDEGHKKMEDTHIADTPAADSSFDNTIQAMEETQKESLSNDDKIIGKGTVFDY